MDTPVIEALSYLDMQREERSQERLERFQYIFFAANSKVDPKARKKFYDQIRPKGSGSKLLNNPNKKMDWDYAAIEAMKKQQNEGG